VKAKEKLRVWSKRTFGVGLKDKEKSDKDTTEGLSKAMLKSIKSARKRLPPGENGAWEALYAEAKACYERNEFDKAKAVMQAAGASLQVAQLRSPAALPGPEDPPTDPDAKQEWKAKRKAQIEERRLQLKDAISEFDRSVADLQEQVKNDPSRQPLLDGVLQARERAVTELKFARMDAKDPYRDALVQVTTRGALLSIEDKLSKLDRTKTGDPTLLEKLGTKLNRIVDEMLSEAVYNFMEEQGLARGEGEEGASYSESMQKLLKDGGKALFEKYPNLNEKIEMEAEHFAVNIGELLDVAHKDKAELGANFFGGANIDGLSDLIIADSDPHNGGRRVTILTFVDDQGHEHKVVNKPRDVRVDAQLTGARLKPGDPPSMAELTSDLIRKEAKKKLVAVERRRRIREVLKDYAPDMPIGDDDLDRMPDQEVQKLILDTRAEARFYEALNDLVNYEPPEDQLPPKMPTYKYLPKDPETEDGHPYGWVEYLEHGRPEDYVLDEAKAKEFYRQTGRMTAIAMLFGIEDLHQGNMMVSNGQPQLTDLEMAFSSKLLTRQKERLIGEAKNSTAFTNGNVTEEELKAMTIDELAEVLERDPKEVKKELQKGMMGQFFSVTIFNQAIGDGTQQSWVGYSKVEDDRIGPSTQPSGGAFERVEDGKVMELTDNAVVLKDGDKLLTPHDAMLARFGDDMKQGFEEFLEAFSSPDSARAVDELLESFEGINVRYHPVATATQLRMRREHMTGGYDDESTAKLDRDVESNLKQKPNGHLLAQKMKDDLKQRDVAYYTQKLGTRQILDNGKTPINGEDGEPLQYFDDDGLQSVRERFEMLRDPEMLELVRQKGNETLENTSRHGGNPDVGDEIRKSFPPGDVVKHHLTVAREYYTQLVPGREEAEAAFAERARTAQETLDAGDAGSALKLAKALEADARQAHGLVTNPLFAEYRRKVDELSEHPDHRKVEALFEAFEEKLRVADSGAARNIFYDELKVLIEKATKGD
jgi:hypothetical protein